jgi:5-methylcytosine-specific restriction endonuclease McrA
MTEEMVARAREMRADGMSYSGTGRALGVAPSTIKYQLDPTCRDKQLAYHKNYYDSDRATVLSRHAVWYSRHKEQAALYQAAYQASHKEEIAAQKADYYAQHRVEIMDLQTVYRSTHREEARARTRTYYRSHVAEATAHANARRAFISGALVGVTSSRREEMVAIYQRAKDDGTVRCYLCGKVAKVGERHVDHIMPLSKGGKHRPSNLAIACATCNLRKNAKLPEEVGVLL